VSLGSDVADGGLVVTAAELRRAVTFEDLIEPTALAFRATSAGRAASQQLVVLPDPARPEAADVLVKAGVLEGHDVFIVKVAPWFLANAQAGQPQGGLVAVFDSHTGHARAILVDEHHLSDIRTAAAGAVVARLLVPPRIESVAVLGTGTQAALQVRALHHERTFGRLTIWGRDQAKAERLRATLADDLAAVEMSVSSDAEAAVRAADVILAATASREPVIRGDWLRAGQHVTAVGADDAAKCELDAGALRRARVFVDSRGAIAANGNLVRAAEAGLDPSALVEAEIGEILADEAFRRDPADVTIATLVGLGAQDVAAASVALQRLDRSGPNP
jgi:ornithine cyclodeaminase